MKKRFILLFTAVLIFTSCETDFKESTTLDNSAALKFTTENGNIMSFETVEDFLKTYEELSMMNPENFQKFIQKNNYGYLASIDTSKETEESIEALMNTEKEEPIYSDALLSIVNKDFQFKIGNEIIRFDRENGNLHKMIEQEKYAPNKRNSYESYGSVVNLPNERINHDPWPYTEAFPNRNRSIRITNTYPGDRKLYVDLFNETINIHNQYNNITSSKMFLRITKEYRSCSSWRCKTKQDNATMVKTNLSSLTVSPGAWTNIYYTPIEFTAGSYTALIANYNHNWPPPPQIVQPFNYTYTMTSFRIDLLRNNQFIGSYNIPQTTYQERF